jgi:hypothetical protein
VRAIFILPGLLHSIGKERWDIDCLRRLLECCDKRPSLKANGRILFLSSIISGREQTSESRLAYWSDFLKSPTGFCYYCEPVHLRADLSDAIVFDRTHFALSLSEAQSLAHALNQYLQGSPYRIEIADSYHWYLLSENEIPQGIPSLRKMHNHPIGGVLTDPKFSSEWRRLMSELQIVLHQQPENMEREQRGELTVNGVWIHSGGCIESQNYAVSHVVSGSLYAQTVTHDFGLECTEDLREPLLDDNQGDILIFDESLTSGASQQRWGFQLESMEARWFKTVHTWLRQKRIDEIVIDPGEGDRFVIRRKSLRRFWRLPRRLDFYTGRRP